MLHPKKVGSIRVTDEEVKRTNEIKTAIPLLAAIDIEGKEITADALLAQRDIATYIIGRKAHYHFTVKKNQKTLYDDIKLFFQKRGEPDFVTQDPPDHGRIETRKIWTTAALNGYLDFPEVGQAFVIERQAIDKKTGRETLTDEERLACGVASKKPEEADAEAVLTTNRGHWTIENSCHHILDWSFDEDRGRIRTGYGPENVTRLRRFAISVIKAKGVQSVAQKMRQLSFNVRLVCDYLRMTANACVLNRSP